LLFVSLRRVEIKLLLRQFTLFRLICEIREDPFKPSSLWLDGRSEVGPSEAKSNDVTTRSALISQ